jgi:hypothetical protein
VRVVPVDPCRVHQAHDRRCALPSAQAPRESQFGRPSATGRIWFSTQLSQGRSPSWRYRVNASHRIELGRLASKTSALKVPADMARVRVKARGEPRCGPVRPPSSGDGENVFAGRMLVAVQTAGASQRMRATAGGDSKRAKVGSCRSERRRMSEAPGFILSTEPLR